MSTLEDLKQAIAQLSGRDRDSIASWIHSSARQAPRVEESVPRYEVDPAYLSVADYLEQEARSEVRHEYVHGAVHAMTGATFAHEVIAGNVFSALHSYLRGKPCRPHIGGFQVRIEINGGDIFYYPDVLVHCDQVKGSDRFTREPRLIIEVLSPSTQSIDRREKLLSYKQIASVEEYILISQSALELIVYRRAAEWAPELATGPDALIELRSIGISLPLTQIYEGTQGME